MDEDLKITSFDTIKGDSFKEEDMDDFLKTIERGINKSFKICHRDKMDADICYEINVYKVEENLYKFSYISKYCSDVFYRNYFVSTKDFPQYTSMFDKYADMTARNEYEKECYVKMENNEKCTTEENAAYLNYLKKLSKCSNKHIFKKLGLALTFPFSFVMLMLSAIVGSHFGIFVFTIITINSAVQSYDAMFQDKRDYEDGQYNVDGIWTTIKKKLMFRKRIKNLKKKLGNEQIEYTSSVINSGDIYKDSVMNYMNNIMNTANGLNPEDKRAVLLELRNILDEYTSKCQAINNGDGLGLTLEGSKKQVMMKTIEKLTALEMKLADIVKRDSKNEVLFSENEKLMQEINNNITNIDEGKKLTLARGR